MDCGPASLKCLLEGFGRRVSYGRLREACQTEVDGTFIGSLEVVAGQLGLEAEQIMIPVDHLHLPAAAALPALVVVRLADGNTHFVVAWRRVGRRIQVMDPGVGRRWPTLRDFQGQCYIHEHEVPAAAWKQWASSGEFLDALGQRLGQVGLSQGAGRRLIDQAVAGAGWRKLAALDAACRWCRSLLDTGEVRAKEAAAMVEQVWPLAIADGTELIPKAYWSVTPSGAQEPSSEAATGSVPPDEIGAEETLMLRGVVLVRVKGLAPEHDPVHRPESAAAPDPQHRADLPPELVAALDEPAVSPWRTLADWVRQGGLLKPSVMLGGAAVAAAIVVMEALLLRALFDLAPVSAPGLERWGVIGLLVAFAALGPALKLPVLSLAHGLGRSLELRLRMGYLGKLMRLPGRYFSSRLVSDMAVRGHGIHQLRQLPLVAERLWGLAVQLLLTALGLMWLAPGLWPWILGAALAAIWVPFLTYPFMAERDLKVRNHGGALSRFYLDSLLGLTAIRSHGAEGNMRRAHEAKLKEWRSASESVLRATVWGEGIQMLVGFALAAGLLMAYLRRSGIGGGTLLLVYWSLRMPALGREIFASVRRLPALRSTTLRLLELLNAPEEEVPESAATSESSSSLPEPNADPDLGTDQGADQGADLEWRGVGVVAGGHALLSEVDLRLAGGEHVAVVGPSGAGKSTLVGLWLGRHRPAEGELRVDGRPLDGARLNELRRCTAWVDPEAQLWNRTLFQNLRYGLRDRRCLPLAKVLEEADLRSVIEALPDGLSTLLGEGGGLVSGGEGQRVRLGRALGLGHPRLVILDEPFRGLDGDTRRRLIAGARQRWRGCTLLCVTHDVADTLTFPRVLVVDGGRVVEDGDPNDLASRPSSAYGALLQAAEAARAGWLDASWRRWRVADGRLSFTGATGVSGTTGESKGAVE